MDQQATEVRHVTRFLELAGFHANVIPGDRPDCVLVIEGRRIGLEHRELIEEDLASNEPNLAWLEKELSAELARRGLDPHFHVSMSANAAAPFFRRRRQVARLVGEVADFAEALAASVTFDAPLQISAPELARKGIVELDFLRFERRRAFDAGPLAYVSRGFWGPVDAALVEAVRGKEQLLAAYVGDASLQEIWLLLVTGDAWQQATDSAFTRQTRVETAFHRVYLMDVRTGEVQRVDDHRIR
ncbi:MAG: hypothetical protein ACJ79H_07630 [Myxococcales bacterium]